MKPPHILNELLRNGGGPHCTCGTKLFRYRQRDPLTGTYSEHEPFPETCETCGKPYGEDAEHIVIDVETVLTDEQRQAAIQEIVERVERGEGLPAADGKLSDEERLAAIKNIIAHAKARSKYLPEAT